MNNKLLNMIANNCFQCKSIYFLEKKYISNEYSYFSIKSKE